MPIDLTDPAATADNITAVKAQATRDALSAIAGPAADLQRATNMWNATLQARLADPLSDTARDTERDAWQVLGDTRTAMNTAIQTAKAARTLTIKTALGG